MTIKQIAVATALFLGSAPPLFLAAKAPYEEEPDIKIRLERMEDALELQKDIEEIRNLQYTYNYYNSGRLYKQVLDLVSEEAGTIEIAGRGVYRGKAGFAKNFHPDEDGRVKDKGVGFGFVLHQLAGMDVITVAPDRQSAKARVRVLTTIFDNYPDTRERMNGGDYEMGYVKEGGKWLIHSMKYVHNFSVSRGEDGTIIPSYSSRADGTEYAPTTWYHPWPETGILPFHFPNPVTGEFPPDVTGKERFWNVNQPER